MVFSVKFKWNFYITNSVFVCAFLHLKCICLVGTIRMKAEKNLCKSLLLAKLLFFYQFVCCRGSVLWRWEILLCENCSKIMLNCNVKPANNTSSKRSEKFMEWHKSAFSILSIGFVCVLSILLLLLLLLCCDTDRIRRDREKKIQFGSDTKTVSCVYMYFCLKDV